MGRSRPRRRAHPRLKAALSPTDTSRSGGAEAAAKVCHEEQMTVWSGEIVGSLAMRGYLRDGLSYDEVLDAHSTVADEIRSIVRSAFSHPGLAPPAGCAALTEAPETGGSHAGS